MDSFFLIPSVITQISNLIEELVIPIETPNKEAKVEMETHLVTVEIKISAQYNSKLYELFSAFGSLIHFDLFLQLNNFLIHLYFSI